MIRICDLVFETKKKFKKLRTISIQEDCLDVEKIVSGQSNLRWEGLRRSTCLGLRFVAARKMVVRLTDDQLRLQILLSEIFISITFFLMFCSVRPKARRVCFKTLFSCLLIFLSFVSSLSLQGFLLRFGLPSR